MRWMLAFSGIMLLLAPAASVLNQPPVALFEPAWEPSESSIVNKTQENYSVFYTFELNASSSYDPDGMIRSYYWERMKARSYEANGTWEIIGRNRSILFNGLNYTEGPNYNFANCYLVFIRLTITDDKGAVNSTQRALCSGVFDEKRMWLDRYRNSTNASSNGSSRETPVATAAIMPAFEIVFSITGILIIGRIIRRI